MKDEELPPLELDISWEDDEKLQLGLMDDPDDFDVALADEGTGLVLIFREKKGLLFKGPALHKLLFVFDTLIHSMVDSTSHRAAEETLSGKKKVTLH